MTGPWEAYQPNQRQAVVYGGGNPDLQGQPVTPEQAVTARALNNEGALDPSAPEGSPRRPYASANNADVPPGAYYFPTGGGVQRAPDQPAPQGSPWAGFAPTPADAKTSEGLGFLKGILKPLDNAALAAQTVGDKGAVGLEGLLKSIGVPTDRINSALGMPSAQEAAGAHLAEKANDTQADWMNRLRLQGTVPGKIGELAGQVVGTLPVAAESPLLAGAASGALLTDKRDVPGILQDMGIGAVGGKVGSMALNGVRGVVAPALSDGVKTLLGEGVKMTPGQILGGFAKSAEDNFTSVPVLGGVVKAAQDRSTDSLNRAATNRILTPLGETLPDDIKTGHEAVAYAGDRVSAAYNSVLPHVQMTADKQFADGLAGLHDDISTLAPAQADQLASILNTNVFSRFDPGSTIDGNAWKQVDSKLGQIASRYGKSPDPDHQQFADVVRSVQGEFRDTLARQNPDYAPTIQAANEGWANLVRVEKAAGKTGTDGGVFSAPQLNQAVTATDNSVRKRAVARGEALMQDLAKAGNSVLPSKTPDSGTAGRGMLGWLALGGGGAALAHNPLPAALAAAATIPYTPLGQRLTQAALTQRPAFAPQLADLLSRLKTPLAIAGGASAVNAANGN